MSAPEQLADILSRIWIVAPDEMGRERAQRVLVTRTRAGKAPLFRAELEFDRARYGEDATPDYAIIQLERRLHADWRGVEVIGELGPQCCDHENSTCWFCERH